MWMPRGGLSRDPFSEIECDYIPLPSHDEAVARIVVAVETVQRRTILRAPAGVGKTVVVRQSLATLRSPRRRLVTVSCPRDDISLLALIAERLGQPALALGQRSAVWRALERAIRLVALQSLQLVLVIDDCDEQIDPGLRRGLDSLSNLASLTRSRLTIIQVESTGAQLDPVDCDLASVGVIRLEPLTRGQTEHYLARKLESAGRADDLFAPRAITRLHAMSAGIPRLIDQITSLCLVAGSTQRLDRISPELVDAVVSDRATPVALEQTA